MFLPLKKRTFYLFQIHLVSSKNQQLPLDKFFSKFICTCSLLIDIQIAILILKNILVNNIPLKVYNGMQKFMTLHKHKVQKPYIIFLNKNKSLFSFNKWYIIWRLKNERKNSNTPHIWVLMLDVTTTNSPMTTKSSSIKLSKEAAISFSSLNFKLKEIA